MTGYETFTLALEAIKSSKVLVCGHFRPDGDCIGSQVAITRYLCGLGIDAVMFHTDEIPVSLIPLFQDTPFIQTLSEDVTNFIVLAVDCADAKRLSIPKHTQPHQVLINIDHHISNTQFAKYNILDGNMVSTTELLYRLFKQHGSTIDPVVAHAIYAGILTDSAQFRAHSVSANTFQICKELVELDANPHRAALELYESRSVSKVLLLKQLLNSMQFEFNRSVVIGILRLSDFAQTGAKSQDTEGLIDELRAIDTVSIAILFEEVGNKSFRASMRSKEPTARLDLLAGHFDGGGHACAAGFRSNTHIKDFYPTFLRTLENHLQSINNQ